MQATSPSSCPSIADLGLRPEGRCPVSDALPSRPDLNWLRNRAKDRLAELRASDPQAKLAEAQKDVARKYGFPSWRALKAHVDAARAPAKAPTADDVVRAFFELVGTGQI